MDAIAAAIVESGKSFPLGAALVAGGANFSVFSKHASAVELLLFDRADDARPSRVIDLDPHTQRTYHYWHAFVPGVEAGQLYGYRAHGPFAPTKGLRFDSGKVLLDPYGKCLARPSRTSRAAARSSGDNTSIALRSVVADPAAYDWKDDRPPRTPFARTVIYELHVGNFTRHPSSAVEAGRRGTFAGVIDKISYLKDLGIAIPVLDEKHLAWRCCVNTFAMSPADICVWSEAQAVQGSSCIVQPRSIVVLVTKLIDVG